MPLLNEFSIQLYSVREETAKDFPGVLKKLGEIGYTGVEFAGYGGIPARDMKKYLDTYGLKSIGSHVNCQRLENNLDEELDYNRIIGTEYMVISSAVMGNRDEALAAAAFANKVGERCLKAGFGFAYHNHDKEFVKDGGDYLLDIFFANVDASICKMELDLYWAAFAGVDPIDYMQRNNARLRLLHIKQIRDYESRQCVDLGDGVIDFKTVVTRGKEYGVEHFILEQEEFAVSAFESVKNGFDHIMSL
ncbi:MAG: sugar phosphate isomerase/epimerase [Oscillospiraceae bacterium]|nr:sugar phosphate isomerase/epimerase [Oscillospiraceae bacterium]